MGEGIPPATLIDMYKQDRDRHPPIEQRLSANQLNELRGNHLDSILLAQNNSTAKKSEVSYGLPDDKYDPRGSAVSENNFKQTISDEGLAWVMYTFKGPRMDPTHAKGGDIFWRVLKEHFGNQVDAFIKIDITNWSDYGAKAENEIGLSRYPSFILYKNGYIVNDGTDKDIRLRGPPLDNEIPLALEYITNNSPLK